MRCSGPSSKVPFALRWLQAVLPSLLGKQKEAVERTYDLMEFCRMQAKKLASGAYAQSVGLDLQIPSVEYFTAHVPPNAAAILYFTVQKLRHRHALATVHR